MVNTPSLSTKRTIIFHLQSMKTKIDHDIWRWLDTGT